MECEFAGDLTHPLPITRLFPLADESVQPDLLPTAQPCIYSLPIERMVKLVTHSKSAIRPRGKPCLRDKLPTACELLASGLDAFQFLLATCCHLDRREAYPIDTCHFEQLLV